MVIAMNVDSATGYAIVVPPGWVNIPLRDGTADAVRAIAKRLFSEASDELPRDDIATYRAQLEGRLNELARQAARNSGIDLYLPTTPRGDVAIPASIVVSDLQLRGGDALNPEDVTRELTEGADSQRVTIDAVEGVRDEQVTPASPERGVPDASRVVKYLLPVPGVVGHWLAITFSTPADGDPQGEFADLLVELFDAIMSTFTWTASN